MSAGKTGNNNLSMPKAIDNLCITLYYEVGATFLVDLLRDIIKDLEPRLFQCVPCVSTRNSGYELNKLTTVRSLWEVMLKISAIS